MNRFLAVVYAIVAAVFLMVAVFIAFEESGLLPSAIFTFLAAVIAYTSWKRWHKPDHPEAVANQNEQRKPLSIARASLYATGLFVLDALIFNQFVLAFVTISVVLPVILFRAIRARKDREVLKIRLITAGIFSLMVVCILTANNLNNQLARNRTLYLAAACEKFKSERGSYPEKLSDLVPAYIPEIHSAKVTLIYSGFMYIAREDRHAILFVAIPPFGRVTYTLENKSWGMID
jgi:hypothetical protein